MKRLTAAAVALALALALTCAAFAEETTIRALPPQIDVNHLEDRYVMTDIEYKGNGIATLTLYEKERFDGEALRAAKPGDFLESEGQTIAVQSTEWDGPDLYFNRGTEQEILFCSYDDVVYERVIRDEDDRNTLVKVGTLEQEILPFMTVLDWVNTETGEPIEDQPVLRTGEDLLKMLENNEAPGFASKNVRILYSYLNVPDLIVRFYSPAQ